MRRGFACEIGVREMNNKISARIRTLFLLTATLLCTVPAVGIADSVLYAIDNENPVLSIVDPVTGVEQSTLGLFVPGDIIYISTGLAVDPTTNKVYAAMKLASVAGSSRSLVEINLETGEGTNIGPMNQPIANIAFDSNGTLYAVSGDCNNGCGGGATPETLFTVNLSNGSLTLFKTLGNGDDGEAIAFNPVDGMMYHMSGRGAGLIFEKINLTTGTVTNIPLSGGSYISPDLEAIGFVFDPAEGLFVGSLIECGCDGGVWSYISLTPTGVLTHVNTLPRWWKGYDFHEEGGASDVFLDLESIPDLDGAVDAAVLVSGLPGDGRSPSIQVFVNDGATGQPVSQMTVLKDNWHAVDMTVAPASTAGKALIAVLARRVNGKNLVAVHRAVNGTEKRKIEFFNNNWAALAVAFVPDPEGPGSAAFAVLAQNTVDNRTAVQLRRRADGSLIHTIYYFGTAGEPIGMEVLDDISGNHRPEIAVLGLANGGKIMAIIKDAESRELINKIEYFNTSVTPRAMTVVGDVGDGPDPELAVLGVKPDGSNPVQVRDAKSDVRINNIYAFSPDWTTLGLVGMDDVNGNSSADIAVLAQHSTADTIRVNVRDAATAQVILGRSFLGAAWNARDLAVFPDITGNGVQELGVVARRNDGSIRVQLRDASTGSIVSTFNIP